MKLSVIIVNWNRKELLRLLLNDISFQEYYDYEIILVDNGSEDGAFKVPEELGIDCKLIRLDKNLGLSAGRNIGLVNSNGKYVFFPDNDLRLPDTQLFNKAINYLETNEFAAVCLHQYNSIEEYEKFKNIISPVYEMWNLRGGASFIKKEVFENIGYFENDFKYSGEEHDFTFRAFHKKYKITMNHNLSCVHKPHNSGRQFDQELMIMLNIMTAQLRYMPFFDAVGYFIWQTFVSFARSVVKFKIFRFIKFFILIIYYIPVRIIPKRNPVSKKIIYRWYAMRLNDLLQRNVYDRMNFIEYYSKLLKIKEINATLKNELSN